MFLFLYWMIVLDRDRNFPQEGYIELPVLVPTVILYVYYLLAESLFKKLAIKLTNWENYKTREEYEEVFMSKLFWFMIVNRLGFPFLIAFVASTLDSIECTSSNGKSDCF